MNDSRQNERLNIIRRGIYMYSQHAMPQTVMSRLADCIHFTLPNFADRSNL